MIININSVLRYDALSVHKASIAIHHGKFTTMDMGHYMYRYPHQIGFLIYEYILGFMELIFSYIRLQKKYLMTSIRLI